MKPEENRYEGPEIARLQNTEYPRQKNVHDRVREIRAGRTEELEEQGPSAGNPTEAYGPRPVFAG